MSRSHSRAIRNSLRAQETFHKRDMDKSAKDRRKSRVHTRGKRK